MELILICGGAAVLAFPLVPTLGVLLERDALRAVTTGLALAPLLWFYAALVLGSLGALRRAWVVGAAITLNLLAALVLWRSWRSIIPPRKPRRWRALGGLLVLLGYGVIVRLWPQGFVARWPTGWDAGFHLGLVRAMELAGAVPFSWRPFADAPVNYPQGAHVLVHLLATITAVPAHLVFNVLIVVVVPVLSGLAMFRLGRACGTDPRWPWAAAAAYLLLANYGSLDYPRWGGLPSALAMAVGVVAVARLAEGGSTDWRATVGNGLLLTSVAVVHHHAMLSLGLFLLVAIALRAVAERGMRRENWHWLAALALMPIGAAPVTWPMLMRILSIRQSRVLDMDEAFDLLRAPVDIGFVLLVLAAIGVWARAEWNRRGQAILTVLAASMASGFVAARYGSRLLSYLLTGEARDAFTPSRFWTNLAYPLAVFAGAGLLAVWDRARRQAPIVAAALAVVIAVHPWQVVRGQYAEPLLPGQVQAGAWLRTQTPPNALVLVGGRNREWAAYLTGRELDALALPVSEIRTDELLFKQGLRALLAPAPATAELLGKVPPQYRPLLERPIFFVREAPLEAPRWQLRFTHDPFRVYEYVPWR